MAPHPTAFLTRALRVARTEIAAVAAMLVVALGVLIFIEVADDIQEADGQAFDHAVLAAVRPFADDPGRPWGPWWLHEGRDQIVAPKAVSRAPQAGWAIQSP